MITDWDHIEANHWHAASRLSPRVYECGFCQAKANSSLGYFYNGRFAQIYICACGGPTLFVKGTHPQQIPGAVPGKAVEHLPTDIDKLYAESRRAYAVGAYTAMTLALRTLIAHVAEGKGGTPRQPFNAALDHLITAGYLTNELKQWVDRIRQKGNDATHHLEIIAEVDAQKLLHFTEVLLRLVYEFPEKAKT